MSVSGPMIQRPPKPNRDSVATTATEVAEERPTSSAPSMLPQSMQFNPGEDAADDEYILGTTSRSSRATSDGYEDAQDAFSIDGTVQVHAHVKPAVPGRRAPTVAREEDDEVSEDDDYATFDPARVSLNRGDLTSSENTDDDPDDEYHDVQDDEPPVPRALKSSDEDAPSAESAEARLSAAMQSAPQQLPVREAVYDCPRPESLPPPLPPHRAPVVYDVVAPASHLLASQTTPVPAEETAVTPDPAEHYKLPRGTPSAGVDPLHLYMRPRDLRPTDSGEGLYSDADSSSAEYAKPRDTPAAAAMNTLYMRPRDFVSLQDPAVVAADDEDEDVLPPLPERQPAPPMRLASAAVPLVPPPVPVRTVVNLPPMPRARAASLESEQASTPPAAVKPEPQLLASSSTSVAAESGPTVSGAAPASRGKPARPLTVRPEEFDAIASEFEELMKQSTA
jgi:hypothetical protein